MNPNSAANPWHFLKTLLISYVITVVMMFLLAFLLYKMKWGVSQVSWGVTAIYAVSCAVGGFLTGRRMKSRRLLWGLLSGILYFAVLLMISLLTGGGLRGDIKSVVTVLASCLGGASLGAAIS